MTSDGVGVLCGFAGGWDAPYVGPFTKIVVLPVRPKTPFGVALRGSGGQIHRIAAVASSCHEGVVRYGARWICGGGSSAIALVREGTPGKTCIYCDDALEPNVVYRCFDAAGRLLYIGSAAARLKRLDAHASQTPWWGEVAKVRHKSYPTIGEARIAERLAILTERPLYNVVGAA